MKIQCPACGAQGNIDCKKVPPDERKITCSRCRHSFLIPAMSSSVPVPSLEVSETMRCPKCGAVQEKGQICNTCGIVIEKYLTLQTRKLEQEKTTRPASKPAELRWYHEILKGRLTHKQVRILTLLVPVSFILLWSTLDSFIKMKKARAKVAAASVQEKQLPRRESDKWTNMVNLYVLEMHLREASLHAIEHCEMYDTTWFGPGARTEDDRTGVELQRRSKKVFFNRTEVEADRAFPASPSGQVEYLAKIKDLAYSYDTIYKAAADPENNKLVHSYLQGRKSDLQKSLDELNKIRPKEFKGIQVPVL